MKYEEIYEKVKNGILSGAYKSGDKLPSKRALAESSGVSVITAEHVYGLLESEGYIEARERSGYFVIGPSAVFDSGKPYKIEPSLPKNDFGEYFPYTLYAKAVRAVLSESGENVLRKSQDSGLTELKIAIKNYLLTSRNVKINENNVIIGAGAEYLYGLIPEILGKSAIYGIENPSYKAIKKVYASRGVITDDLTLGKDGIKTEELNRTKASVLHVTPYRSYPTGVSATAGKKREYLDFIKSRNGYIVEDDYDSEFSLNARLTETLFSLGSDRVIYINTFSKTVCPAIRAGYMILPDKLLKIYKEKADGYSCSVPTLEQLVLCKILSDGSFARHISKVRRNRKNNLPR